MNHDIPSPTVRVVDEQGENIGVLSKDEALQRAVALGLDLIQINALTDPPVVKIISFDKFRYQQEKEEKKQRQAQKQKELKQVRITGRAAQNDLLIRAKAADKFLEEGHKVEINLALRGREKAHKEWALQKMQEFLSMITVPYALTMAPKQGGRGYVAQITKK